MNFIDPNSRTESKFTRNALIAMVLILILGAGGTAAYFYKKYSTVKNTEANVAKVESDATVAAVGKLIMLPADEEPTVATVTDPSKLQNQTFFAHAKVGDKVLLYVKAKKAILYDPSANKLVEVAPLNLDDSNAPQVSGGTTTETK
jgi:hypothetical protein